MNLTPEQMDSLQDFCDNNEYDLREGYSGRSMYGKECIGIVTDDNPFAIAMNMVEAAEYDDDFPLDAFKDANPRMDSMGLSTIVYFPRVQAPETADA